VADLAGAVFERDLEKTLARGDVHGVASAAYNSQKAELVTAAAEAGKHIMCEKPMATTLEDCDRMIDAIERAGVKYYQVFPMRCDPVNLKIKELVDGGALGRVSMVRKRHGHFRGLEWQETNPSIWYASPTLNGGGAFLDEGIHAADWLCWMLGKPTSVMAQIDTVQTSFPVDDMGVAIYRFPGKTMGVLQSSWLCQSAPNSAEIYGEFGTIVQRYTDGASTRGIGEVSSPLSLYMAERKAWQVFDLPVHFPKNHEAVVAPFVDCIIEDTEPLVTAADGRRALEVILAAYESARKGRLVELSP
jgi:predicted dehydrogenase